MAPPFFRAATAIAVVVVLATASLSVSWLVQPPVKPISVEEWSFELHPYLAYEDLNQEQLDFEWQQTHHSETGDYCPAVVRARYEIYQQTYPRYSLIAGTPRAFQRFLYAAVEASYQVPDVCFPAELIARVIDRGVGRCNLLQQSGTVDPILQADIEKLIEQIEWRHIMTVDTLMNNPTLIESNRLHADTLYYLSRLSQGQNSTHLYFPYWENIIRERDPDRVAFIETAATYNGFREVLRTNPPCRSDDP